MFNFYGKKQEKQLRRAEQRANRKSPSLAIGPVFDPELINTLKREHQEQMQCAVVILETAHEAQFERTRAVLSQFRWNLQEHLNREDAHLYAYLAWRFKDDAQRMPLLSGVRSDMADIGRQVLHLAQHYDDSGVDHANVNRFLREFDEILKVLAKRNDYEESWLFPMYLYPKVVTASQARFAEYFQSSNFGEDPPASVSSVSPPQ